MREVIGDIETWQNEGKSIALATIVKKEGASLRSLGAKMAVTPAHEIAGSVTGGCIEGAVYEEAQNVINNHLPILLHYGVTDDETPWEIGLSCGGTLDVLLEPLDTLAWREIFPALKKCLHENQLATVATVISGPSIGNKLMLWPDGHTLGSLGSTALNEQAIVWMQNQITIQETNWTSLKVANEAVEVFVDVFVPAARVIIVGAVHIAIPLITLAKTLGYHTIVIDPRKAFATRERFPHVDELINEWPSTALDKLQPDESTYIAVLSHDEKIDAPALQVALASPARYVGALGARKTIPQRFAALMELGVTEEQLSHLHTPIGMNMGAIQPDEIALSILAEMIATRRGMLKT
ncbi:MAG: XdhC/CoxI family protein [Leptolinea sp.]